MNVTDYYKFLFKNVLRPFQREILTSALNNTKVGVLGSRQIGKTYAISFLALILGLGTKKIPGHNVLLISENEAKAKKLIADIHDHLNKMEKVCGELRQPNRGGLFEVVLLNGSVISAKPGKPSALKAWSGSVIVDELSLTQHDPEELFGQALIVASAKPYFRTIICTNADHDGSFVQNLWFNRSPDWTKRREEMALLDYNVYDVYEELPSKIKQIKSTIDSKLWRKFYLNEFLTGNLSYFDPNLISAATTNEISHKDPLTVICYDPGFSKDGSGIIVVEVSDRLKVIEEDLIFKMDIEDQIKVIDRLQKKYNVGSIIYDSGVGGIVVGQQLKRLYGNLAKPVSINRNFYQRTAAELERLLFEGKVQIPATCTNLIEDLKSFEKSSNGILSVPKRLLSDGNKTHLDCGVALLFSLDYLRKEVSSFILEPVNINHSFGKFL